MTRSTALVRIGLNSGRWLLPWIAVLFVSATLAYAVSHAIADGASPSDQPVPAQAAGCAGASAATVTGPIRDSQDVDEQDFRVRLLAQRGNSPCTGSATIGAATREPSITSLSRVSADPGDSHVSQPCEASAGGPMDAGVDWWIVTQSRKLACEPGRQ